ncbi:MAG: GGDEF domain-containing protein [Steroidobacteraceae bacterium]
MEHAKTDRFESQRARFGSRLRFAGELELEFRAVRLRRTRARTRLWQSLELFVGPILVYLHYNTHAGTMPHGDQSAHELVYFCGTFGFIISVVLLVLALRRFDVQHYQRVAAWLTPVRTVVYAVIVADFVDMGGAGTAALTAATFGHFFFSGLLFHHALAAACATLGAFFAALLFHEVPAGLTAYAVATVAAVQTMAAVVAHDAQRAARIAFLEHGAVRTKAEHDGLTGLRNRRDFDERFAAFWDQAQAAQEPLTVLMIDVDHFKAYNDRYGHQAGDEVLRRVAQAVRLAARSSDVVARYGGEEFVMLASGLDEAAAAALCERIRATIQELAILHEESSCAHAVTVSIGAAHVLPQPGRSPEGALQLADENLYRAKQQGRNAYVLHGADYESLRTGRFRHQS